MKILRRVSVGTGICTLVVFVSGGLSFSGKAYAQTTSATTNQQGQSEFKYAVEQGVQEVKNDTGAQNNQREIDGEDNEGAGDNNGDVKEIDGENSQDEIDNEIEQEVDQEDAAAGQSPSDQESGASSGVNTVN